MKTGQRKGVLKSADRPNKHVLKNIKVNFTKKTPYFSLLKLNALNFILAFEN